MIVSPSLRIMRLHCRLSFYLYLCLSMQCNATRTFHYSRSAPLRGFYIQRISSTILLSPFFNRFFLLVARKSSRVTLTVKAEERSLLFLPRSRKKLSSSFGKWEKPSLRKKTGGSPISFIRHSSRERAECSNSKKILLSKTVIKLAWN